MQKTYYARITQIANSTADRLPKELAFSLSSKKEISEQTAEGILIKQAPAVPPLSQWAVIFATADLITDDELDDWDVTLQDGLEHD
jgi:hypothetical protein